MTSCSRKPATQTEASIGYPEASSTSSLRATCAAVARIATHAHTEAARMDAAANSRGGLARSGPTRQRPHHTSAAAYSTSPATDTGRIPDSDPPMTTTIAPTSTGSAWRASRSARSSMRVRNTVGQNVTRVPTTVRPIQPSSIVMVCATSSDACHRSSSPQASAAPNPAPTGRQAAAAT